MLTNTQELTNLLLSQKEQKAQEIDPKNYKYVIYARKSTNAKDKQERSLSDQVSECQEEINKHNLNCVEVITEQESASEPDIRPKFRQIIDDLKAGKYDGVITWHPDRLARNMKEAGEIIDLLDKQIIKDLRFRSFSFTNDTNGKVLLGIAFVLSKQYTDKLSTDVSRGIQRSIAEGKFLRNPKHGYKKDRNLFLRPDDDNFVLIKKAFQMRIDDYTLDEIANYLNEKKYTKATKHGEKNKKYTMDKKRVSEFLKDTFFTGVLQYGEGITDLTTVYDFIPAVTVKEFHKINKNITTSTSKNSLDRKHPQGSVRADFLRGMVICKHCKNTLKTGISSKKYSKEVKKEYFYFRCESSGCKYKNKSIRAKVILEHVYQCLEDYFFTSDQIYADYKKRMNAMIAKKEKELLSKNVL